MKTLISKTAAEMFNQCHRESIYRKASQLSNSSKINHIPPALLHVVSIFILLLAQELRAKKKEKEKKSCAGRCLSHSLLYRCGFLSSSYFSEKSETSRAKDSSATRSDRLKLFPIVALLFAYARERTLLYREAKGSGNMFRSAVAAV